MRETEVKTTMTYFNKEHQEKCTVDAVVSTNTFVLHGVVYFSLALYIHRLLHPKVDKDSFELTDSSASVS